MRLLLDWFVIGDLFRLSGVLTITDTKLVLDGSGSGGTINVGGTVYTTTAADGFTATIKYPSTMPYIGIGWGHQAGSGQAQRDSHVHPGPPFLCPKGTQSEPEKQHHFSVV